MARREPSLAPPASSSPHIEETAPVLAGESSVGGGLGGGEGDEGGGSSASSQLKATGSGVFLVLDGGDSAAKWDAKLHTVRPHSAPALPGQHRPNHRLFVAGLGRSAVQQGTHPEPCPVSRALFAHLRSWLGAHLRAVHTLHCVRCRWEALARDGQRWASRNLLPGVDLTQRKTGWKE